MVVPSYELGLTERIVASSYRDSIGGTLPRFELPKLECLILVSGYSVALRAAIICLSAKRLIRFATKMRSGIDRLEMPIVPHAIRLI